MKSIHLMKNVGRFTPPRNRQVRFTLRSPVRLTPPRNCQVRLTPKSSVRFTLESSLAIYTPRNGQVKRNHTDDLRVNRTWRFEGKSDLAISGGGKSYR